MTSPPTPFDPETWAQLPRFLEKLPQPIHLTVWGDAAGSQPEQEAVLLSQTLAQHFDVITCDIQPRRENYPFYPVIGIMGAGDSGEERPDFGVRIIGLPAGYQLTSLISAIQVVSFRGQTLEPVTRIKLSKLTTPINIEIITDAENETGAVVAKHAFGLAVAHPQVRAFLIMADTFPEVLIRYSVRYLPHTVINGRVHITGVIDEATLLKQIANAL